MKFSSLLERVPKSGVFRTGEVIAGIEDCRNVQRQLVRWARAGRLEQLRREVYLVCPPYRVAEPHPFVIANILRRGTYVSLHSALSHYGMIPEYVPVVTSVTGARPEELNTPVGRFHFRHVGAAKFFGFSEREIAPGQNVLIATPEKALCDLLYLTPRSDDGDYLESLRLEQVESFSLDRLWETCRRLGSDKVKRAVALLAAILKKEAMNETTLD